jgi:hypothetical protein
LHPDLHTVSKAITGNLQRHFEEWVATVVITRISNTLQHEHTATSSMSAKVVT